jgi:general secretion pathway protein A
MYTEYFGLAERPFSITPDPHFLYLSRRHREALGHLVYGTGEGGGFVLLTGEVGTGKTTVCRACLEQLPPEVDAALVLNPPPSAPELLLALCAELHLAPPPQQRSRRELLDFLNAYLLAAHARGRRTVLIIDEAQNLGAEVLEQIRLLTNLETHKHKLLQIFLIGQPELREALAKRDLRQLAQRVTARYHLGPLTRGETAEYVQHRLSVAGRQHPLFSPRALRRVHRESRGLPRLINVICDRALLGAYARNRALVDAGTVRYAARELRGETHPRALGCWQVRLAGLAGAAVLAGVGWLAVDRLSPPEWWARSVAPAVGVATALEPPVRATTVSSEAPAELETGRGPSRRPDPQAVTDPIPASSSEVAPVAAEGDAPEPPPPLVSVLETAVSDRGAAEEYLLSLWGLPPRDPGSGPLCDWARHHDLRCLAAHGGWEALRGYDHPALIRLAGAGDGPHHATVVQLAGETAAIDLGGEIRHYPLQEVEPHWDGEFLLLWQPPVPELRVVRPGATGAVVLWIESALDRVQGAPVTRSGPPGIYDGELITRVRAFQHTHGLVVDGVVGPLTAARLLAALPDRNGPRLSTGG